MNSLFPGINSADFLNSGTPFEYDLMEEVVHGAGGTFGDRINYVFDQYLRKHFKSLFLFAPLKTIRWILSRAAFQMLTEPMTASVLEELAKEILYDRPSEAKEIIQLAFEVQLIQMVDSSGHIGFAFEGLQYFLAADLFLADGNLFVSSLDLVSSKQWLYTLEFTLERAIDATWYFQQIQARSSQLIEPLSLPEISGNFDDRRSQAIAFIESNEFNGESRQALELYCQFQDLISEALSTVYAIRGEREQLEQRLWTFR